MLLISVSFRNILLLVSILWYLLIWFCCVGISSKTRDLKPSKMTIFVCHWNINSIPSHNFQKIAVLESFVAMHKFDIICISETFLSNTYENNNLNLNCYSLLRVDHSSNAKRGGVCIYCKETLAPEVISTPYLNENLLCEVTIG